MQSRHRIIAAVTLAAFTSQLAGCATTDRYVVAPDAATDLRVKSIYVGYNRPLKFETESGVIDLSTMTIRGHGSHGKMVEQPISALRGIDLADAAGVGTFRASLDPLVEGEAWRPQGKVQYVVRRSGVVVDLRKRPTLIDPPRQRVLWSLPVSTTASAPFDEVLYVQIREGHPGRTVLLVAGSALAALGIAYAIAMSTTEIGLGK